MGKVVAIDQIHPASGTLAMAAKVLASHGVLVMPTDSVYGIGCAATPANPAYERIFTIKGRNRAQVLPWLVANESALDSLATDVPAWARELARHLWPGALTLVVKARFDIDRTYVAADGTLALRVPASPLVQALAETVGPLAVTSANTHGLAAATSGESIESGIAAAADLVLDAGPAPLGVASTIVDATGDLPRVLREGALSTSDVFVAAGLGLR